MKNDCSYHEFEFGLQRNKKRIKSILYNCAPGMNSPEFDLAPNLTGDDELWTDAEKHNDALCVFIDGVYGHICRFSVQAHSVTFAGTNCIMACTT